MRSQAEIETERDKLDSIFKKLSKTGFYSNGLFAQGALHALEWVLSNEFKPLSELQALNPHDKKN